MVWLKPVELAFRRFLVRLLRLVVRRSRPLDPSIDFNDSKFLFLRQDLIGDALVSTPVFDLLKQQYPRSTIDVLLSPRNVFVLQSDPAVRKRWVYRKNPIHVLSLLRDLRSERYDFVVDLVDNPSATSTALCLLSGARWRVGLEKKNDFVYDIAVAMPAKSDVHVAERTARVLLPFGIDPAKKSLFIRYYVSGPAQKFADDFWTRQGLNEEIVLGVNISAGEEVRSWWRSSCRSFLQEIMRRYPAWKILILLKPSDRSKAEAISEEVRDIIVSPDTPSFDHLAALVKRLTFLVTPDTSVVQIAAAFQIPALVLHLKISSLHGYLWEPFNSDSANVIASVDNVETIPFTEVVDAFESLVARHQDLLQRKRKVTG